MPLQEQIYHNTNRKYYHGANSDKTIYGKYIRPTCFRLGTQHEIPMTWITTNVLYAMEYVGVRNGKYIDEGRIYILNLVDKTNIFNIQHEYDRRHLLKELFHRDNITLKEQELFELFSKDWVMLEVIERWQLQRAIKELGYEGLFNFENGENYAPSVGLFNAEKAKIIEEVPSSEFSTKFAKQLENGKKRSKVVLLENFEVSKKNAKKAKVCLKILKETMDELYSDINDDLEYYNSDDFLST